MPKPTQFLVDYPPDPRRTIFVAGSGRSGTTWLSEIINYDNDYRDLFEPFDVFRVPLVKPFRRNQYLRPNDPAPAFFDAAQRIVTGRVQGEWIDRYNHRRVANRRIIKDIRSTHFLKWLAVHFPSMPIVYILRHPLAVIHSRMQLNWDSLISDFLAQPTLIEDHLEPFLPAVERAAAHPEPSFERHVFFWCIENYVPLRQFQPTEFFLAFYENLCVKPETEIPRLFSFLRQPYDARILRKISVPSSQSRPVSAVKTGDDLLSSWQDAFTPAQIDYAMEIVQMFGLDRFYTRDPLPHHRTPNPVLS